MKRGHNLCEFRDDLAHTFKMLIRGEFSQCVCGMLESCPVFGYAK